MNQFQPSPGPKPGRDASNPKDATISWVFQPSPGPKPGRDPIAATWSRATPTRGFNPRPGRSPGATRRASLSFGRTLGFQPSPGPKPGRDRRQCGRCGRGSWFQPSPGPKPGRDTQPLSSGTTGARRFNPRPGRSPGATVGYMLVGMLLELVSTLARAEARARQTAKGTGEVRPDPFQPSPGPKPGRDGVHGHVKVLAGGQEKSSRW